MPAARLLVIDAGTTGIRALVYDENAQIVAQTYTEFPQYHPAPDRVEQDAGEIWDTTQQMITGALAEAGLQPGEVTAIGITNQRATTVMWNASTGEPVTRAIVWQDTRTADRAAELTEKWGDAIYARTGWAIAPVYSSLSVEWMLNNVHGLRELADDGQLRFGTVESWLIYKLTGGATHAISASNASVTGSYDMLAGAWHTSGWSCWASRSRSTPTSATTPASLPPPTPGCSAQPCRSRPRSPISIPHCSPRAASSRAWSSAPTAPAPSWT